MKKTWILLLCLLSISLAAQEKKEIVLNTEVSEATVFIKGAQVIRKTTANFPAGKSAVRFAGLSPYVDAKSVQVKIDGEVMVLSVNYQLNYNDSIKAGEEAEKYTKQINDIDEKIKSENINKEIVGEELAFLRENKKIGGTEGINTVNLKATALYYGERMSELKKREMEIDKKLKTLSDEKKSVEQKLAVLGNQKTEPAGEVVLNVDCKTDVKAPIELSYYVNNAGWYPTYDIRAKNVLEPVELIYKANIMQNTKEGWKNIKLKISSANPNLGNVAPKLSTYFLNYYAKPPRYDSYDQSNQVRGRVYDGSLNEPMPGANVVIKGTTIGTMTDRDGNFTLTLPSKGGRELVVSFTGYIPQTVPVSSSYMTIVLEEDAKQLDEVVALGYGVADKEYHNDRTGSAPQGRAQGVMVKEVAAKPSNTPIPVVQVENQTSIEFEIKMPYTILSENKNTTVEMEHYSLPAEYEYHCVPKIDRDAFLQANIPDWEQYNLLEGEANVFFENTYVGKTILDVRYQSDTLNISLGRDKNVPVKREKIKEYTSRKFMGSKTETTRGWKISVKNNKSQPISVVLFDQIPVSTLQEIEVSPEKLSGGELNNDTGEVKWKFTLPPTQTNEIDFRYKVKYPKGRTLTVE